MQSPGKTFCGERRSLHVKMRRSFHSLRVDAQINDILYGLFHSDSLEFGVLKAVESVVVSVQRVMKGLRGEIHRFYLRRHDCMQKRGQMNLADVNSLVFSVHICQ